MGHIHIVYTLKFQSVTEFSIRRIGRIERAHGRERQD